MSAVVLRDYQVDIHERIATAEARGCRRQLVVAATGLGKTVVFTTLAEKRGGRTLILAHRDELIEQAVAKVREVWPAANVGVVKAERNEVTADVVVASVQTLARPARMDRLCAPFDGSSMLAQVQPFDLVVVDEAHHATAKSYRGILDRLRAGCPAEPIPDEPEFDVDPPGAGPLLLGVTATPDRGDGKGLRDVFDEIVASYDLLWGIRSGYLSDVRGKRVSVVGFDPVKLKVNRGDFDQGQAGAVLDEAGADEMILAAWQEEADGRPTIVFTPTVAFAHSVAWTFNEAGVPAAAVDASTPQDERRAMLRRYSAGELRVLVNCGVLTEGFDSPATSCIVVARPTRSRALYAQMVGRGTRRHPDKVDCLVLDVVGATDDLSLVTIPSLFGIDAKPHRARLGDGTALVSDIVAADEAEKVAAGLLRAEEVELFKALRGAGIAWVQVHRDGDELRRYEVSYGREEPRVVLAQRVPGEDVWTAGLWAPDGGKAALVEKVTQSMAQGVAEDWIRANVGDKARLVDSDAKWRKGKPTPRQRAAAAKWKLPGLAEFKTAGELSDALDAHIARIKARPAKNR